MTGSNFLTIDLEDWHQAYKIRYATESQSVSRYFEQQMDSLLECLNGAKQKATFFCLGKTAESKPEIIRALAAEGHDLQSHGFGHQRVGTLTPQQFREDLRKGKETIENLSNRPVIGYRAPEFSLNAKTPWAWEVLAAVGFEYDSSVFPFHGTRYGWPGFPRHPVRVKLGNGTSLCEYPVFTTQVLGRTWPLGGGGYFRLIPEMLLLKGIQRSTLTTRILYFHPYEFGNRFLDIREAAPHLSMLKTWKINWMQNLFKKSIKRKVVSVLERFPCSTLREYHERQKPKSSILLSSIR